MNDVTTPFINDYQDYKEKLLTPYLDSSDDAKKLLPGAPTQASVTLVRNNDTLKSLLAMDSNGNFNIMMVEPKKLIPYEHINFSVGSAIKRAGTECIDFTVNQAKGLWGLFTKKEIKAKNSLGGFKSFTKLFNPQFSWKDFLSMLATISILLAFMNFLPIPGLDGGYILFLIWEMITGKKVSDRFLEKANSVGLILIMALLIYANGLDFIRK
jgi:regulator of sigma E protease